MKGKKPVVTIVMGSETDLPVMKSAGEALKRFGIPFEVRILSAHRAPHDVARFAEAARAAGIRVVVAGAGGAAHLPGVIASYTDLPVVGVPVSVGPLKGQDAFLSILQMPKGIPVATVAIGNAWNGGILAARILSISDLPEASRIARALCTYKRELRAGVLKTDRKLKG